MTTIRRELFKQLRMTPLERDEAEAGRCAGSWHIWTPGDNGDTCRCGTHALFVYGGLSLVQDAEATLNETVTQYWLRHYTSSKAALCGLCGNTGQIDTRATAISPAGVRAGGLYFCICPNGQTRRALDDTQ